MRKSKEASPEAGEAPTMRECDDLQPPTASEFAGDDYLDGGDLFSDSRSSNYSAGLKRGGFLSPTTRGGL
jgi:hypothetical protein